MTKAGRAASLTDTRQEGTPAGGCRLPLDRVDAVVFNLHTVLRDKDSAYPDAVRLLSSLRKLEVPAAVVSGRRDGREQLVAAGLGDLFGVVVDGGDAEREGLSGPPDPAVLLRAAGLLAAHPARVAVVQDTATGVQAGCRGGFGLVVGVDRAGGHEAELRAYGAQWVLRGLEGVTLDEEVSRPRWWQRGPALNRAPSMAGGSWTTRVWIRRWSGSGRRCARWATVT